MAEIIFHIGPRKCGKSLFVENELKQYTKKIYIGTLPNKKAHLSTIEHHRERRGHEWNTFEISTRFDTDLLAMHRYLYKAKDVDACMLDGVITWYLYLQEVSGGTIDKKYFSEKLARLIKAHPVAWRIVDVNPEIFRGVRPNWRDFRYIHYCLINKLKIKNLIDWSYE